MEHLTVDEIIQFVSLKKLDKEAIVLSAYVNGHIRKCKKCFNVVSAFQMIYDEFSRLGLNDEFGNYVNENILREMDKEHKIQQLQKLIKELEADR